MAGKKRLARDAAQVATSGEVKDLHREVRHVNILVADLTLECRLLKKHGRRWERRGIGYPASEKPEIIQLVEQSHLPVRQTLEKLSIPRPTFYRWHERYRIGGPKALEDRRPQPGRVWKRIPDELGTKSQRWRSTSQTCRRTRAHFN